MPRFNGYICDTCGKIIDKTSPFNSDVYKIKKYDIFESIPLWKKFIPDKTILCRNCYNYCIDFIRKEGK